MRRLPVQALVTVLACCTLWIALGSQIVTGARRHDFLNLYTGASLALAGNYASLHDPAVQLQRERVFVPGLDALVPFVRPHFYAAMLAPLALLPFAAAFWFWLAWQSLLLLGCWIWGFRRWGSDALVFGALYLPTALGIAHGQDCVVMLVIAIAVFELASRERPLTAGAVLGLGLIKFHLWLLWPLVLLFERRWRMLTGYAVAVVIEILTCWLLGGTQGLVRYGQLLRKKDIEHLNPSPELMVNVHGLTLNLGTSSLWIRGALVLFTVGLVLLAARRAQLWRSFAAAGAGSLLVAPHVYGYDAGLLLLGVWLAIFCSSESLTRLAGTTLATPIPFLLTLAGTPWSAAAPLVLLLFLICLAFGPAWQPRKPATG